MEGRGYTIRHERCIGWAGPHYTKLHLKKGRKKYKCRGHFAEDGTVHFQTANDQYLIFDLHHESVKELKPQKPSFLLEEVDSVLVFQYLDSVPRQLNQASIQKLLELWDEAEPTDLRPDFDRPVFYPNHKYEFFVYSKGNSYTITASTRLVADMKRWVYMVPMKSAADTNQFHDLFKQSE